MTRSATLLFTACLGGTCLMAQSHWARRAGGLSNDAWNGLVADPAGNSYVAGEFGGIIALGAVTLQSQGSLDAMVAKYNANGVLQWIRTFGGPGLDRAIALALGPGGELVVTGQFMGTVQFGGQELVSQGGTQDVFVLRLSPANGGVLWARQGGGADGVDQPNGISVGPDGSVAVTGEFRGTAVFDAGTLISMPDPLTGEPSVDIFVAAYTADGDALWLKHGAAKYADRGMGVAHDPEGNVYVTGQFSDTLTIDATHPNLMFSAIFLVRFGPGGDEQWFRILGGATYNQVFALAMVDSTRLMMAGDLQGTVIFLDNAPDLFTAVEPRSSFLVEVGLDGEFIRQTTWGSEHVVNTRALSVKGNEVAVLGRFQCQFTGFSAITGAGTWLATGHHDLYVARFDLDDLTLKDAQQFGGQRNKVPGGIGHLPGGELVFAGSFDRLLVFPCASANAFHTTPPNSSVQAPWMFDAFCDDEDYGNYVGLRGRALMDAFIAKGFVEGRQPYDIFHREPGLCQRPQRDLRIVLDDQGVTGPDTLAACHMAQLHAFTHTAFTPDTAQRHTAPHFHFLWNTGDTTAKIMVYTSGWYHVTATSQAGCWQRHDSLYVVINPLPAPPLVSDDVVVNTATPSPQHITVCEPQHPWLWVSGYDATHTVQWSGPPGTVLNDSIHATASGWYLVKVTSPAGCVRQKQLRVTILPNGPLPPLEAVYEVVFPQDTDHNDTVAICMNMALIYAAHVQLWLDSTPVSVPYGVRVLANCNHQGWHPVDTLEWPWVVCHEHIGQEGWYTFDLGIMLTNAPCGEDTLIFWRSGSIYVIPLPLTYPYPSLSGPPLICPGDSATIALSCVNCTGWNWTGPSIVANLQDQIVVNGPGYYGVQAQHVDTNGCITTATAVHHIQWNPNPLLGVIPADGIICPDSSATIYTTAPGTNFQWYGPFGPLNVANDTIVTSQQGLYYLEMVDPLGCPVTSDPVLITDFATPYLNVLPDNVLCEPGETAVLQVVTTGQSSLQWMSPLAGNALQQVVGQPGIYTCSVNACNITHLLSVEVYGPSANAQLPDPAPFTLCPDDGLVLNAPPGNAIVYWLPGPVFGPQFAVPGEGTYTLVAIDANGCQDQAEVQVEVIEWTEPMVVLGDTVCLGTPVVLSASGSGTITWYADAATTLPLATGAVLDLGVPAESIAVYAVQQEGDCTSAAAAVHVLVAPAPDVPAITGPAESCMGSPVTIAVAAVPGTTYSWDTPTGPFTGAVLHLPEPSPDDAGLYTVHATIATCTSPPATHVLTLLQPEPLAIGPDTLICPGGTAVFEVPPGFGSPLWNDGSTAMSHPVSTPGMVWLSAVGSNGCPNADTAFVQVFAFTQPLVTTGGTICLGASITLLAEGSGELLWYGDSGLSQLVHTGGTWHLEQPAQGALYHVVQVEGPCVSAAVPVQFAVMPTPMDAVVLGPQEVCLGTSLVLELSGSDQPTGLWTTPVGTFGGAVLQFPEVALDHAGTYAVVPFIGPCIGDTLWTHVTVLLPQAPDLGPDTSFCEGGWAVLEVPPGHTNPEWSTGAQTMSIVVDQPGTYGLWTTDPQGCPAYGEVHLSLVPCDDFLPNVITPNGDGTNDVWAIAPDRVRSARLTVFNRLGGVVWEGDPSRTGFAGRHHLSGEILSEGTYYYVLLLERTSGGTSEHRGYLTLVR